MFEIIFPLVKCEATKRDILRNLALIYNPLGFVSPAHLMGKIIYRMICEKKLEWDNTITTDIIKVWDKMGKQSNSKDRNCQINSSKQRCGKNRSTCLL